MLVGKPRSLLPKPPTGSAPAMTKSSEKICSSAKVFIKRMKLLVCTCSSKAFLLTYVSRLISCVPGWCSIGFEVPLSSITNLRCRWNRRHPSSFCSTSRANASRSSRHCLRRVSFRQVEDGLDLLCLLCPVWGRA